MINNNYFGDYLRKRRKENNLTLKELAEKLQLTHGYISNVENCKMKANIDLIQGIYAVLGIPIEESLVRLKLDNGEFIQFKKDIKNTSKEVKYNNILTNMFYLTPGRFYLLILRIESKKTFTEISQETKLTNEDVISTENRGPKSLNVLKKIGRCYGKDNVFHYLNAEVDLPPISIGRTQKLLGAKNGVSEFEETMATLWGDFESINIYSKALNTYDKPEPSKTADLYNLINEFDHIYFNKKLLNEEERKKAIQVLELFFI